MLLLPRTASRWVLLSVAMAMVMLAPGLGRAQVASNPAASESHHSGSLYDQLVRADSLLFDALFTQGNAERATAALADDAEFYDDRSGLSGGDDLRSDFRRLAENCPANR